MRFWLENIAKDFQKVGDKVMEHSYAYGRDYLLEYMPDGRYVGYDFDGGSGGHFLFSATIKSAGFELLP